MGSGCSKEQDVAPTATAPVRLATSISLLRDQPEEQMHSSGTGLSDTNSATNNTTSEAEHHAAPLPADEEERMATLKSLKVLDTEPEKRFDDITKLCCMIFKAPICLVSLVDSERQWFKSVQGLDVRETDRKSSFCAWTLLPACPEVLVVENALEDVRFRNNALVIGFPHIRFYAGTPLVASDGKRLGSLCIIDNKARTFDADVCNLLANFGEMVVRELEKDKMLQESIKESVALTQERTQLLRAINCFSEAIMLCNLALPSWPIMFANEAWERATGITKEMATASGFWSLFKLKGSEESAVKIREAYLEAIMNQSTFTITVDCQQEGHLIQSATLLFKNATNNNIDSSMPLVGIPSILKDAPANNRPCYYYASLVPTDKLAPVSASSAKNFSLVNDKLDPFEDVRLGPLLGRGAFGRVYRGQWNGTSVAVKVLEHEQSESGEMMEALLSGQFSHPNVVATYKYCTRTMPSSEDMDRQLLETWIIMEFCDKGTLSDAVDRGYFRQKHSLFEVDYDVILATAKEMASAMTYLHSQNTLHGDLTGQNILMTNSDKDQRRFKAKVADFGFSRVLESKNGRIKTKTYGTISHTPPELLMDGTLSKAADVYAFGMLLWEMFMGQRPFMGMTQGQIIHHISSRRGLSLSSSCPPPLRKLILSCCNVNFEERPTFSQLLEDLDELEQELC